MKNRYVIDVSECTVIEPDLPTKYWYNMDNTTDNMDKTL